MLPTVNNPQSKSFFSPKQKLDDSKTNKQRKPFYSLDKERGPFSQLILSKWHKLTRRGALSDLVNGRISPRRILLGLVGVIFLLWLVFHKRSTLVLTKIEVERVWAWELASGHYPSRRSVHVRLPTTKAGVIENPGIPPSSSSSSSSSSQTQFVGTGLERQYLPIFNTSSISIYPRRPIPGATIDLDLVMAHCDFALHKYVRDCLALLRANAGLDQALSPTSYLSIPSHSFLTIGTPILKEEPPTHDETLSLHSGSQDMQTLLQSDPVQFGFYLSIHQRLTILATRPSSSPPRPRPPHPSHPTADQACDPDHPRIFHIWWTNEFSDKPYVLALSFLYTQRLSLNHPIEEVYSEPNVCRPQLWIWINDSEIKEKGVEGDELVKEKLKKNEWAKPLLHKRFEKSIKFKVWNTEEQLDQIAELKGWRNIKFKSGGKTVKNRKVSSPPPLKRRAPVPAAPLKPPKEPTIEEIELSRLKFDDDSLPPPNPNPKKFAKQDPSTSDDDVPHPDSELFNRGASLSHQKGAKSYDKLSVILSDLSRFVLLHLYGGIYLDSDNVLLRDWEELWSWEGAFAYRWGRLPLYNTAVLKLNRGSALGSAVMRTAVGNDGDFHPMSVSRFAKEAGLEELLLRLPDALFDPAWLNTNTEKQQRDRPAFPYFKEWEDFFHPATSESAAPGTLGFKGFFRGAFSYHYHNMWWLPFDPHRNYPDLGSRFETLQLKTMRESSEKSSTGGGGGGEDKDLSWATTLKRTFEKFIRGEAPSAYGEWINWDD